MINKCWNCEKSWIWCSEKESKKFIVYLQYKPFREKLFCSEKCLKEYEKEIKK